MLNTYEIDIENAGKYKFYNFKTTANVLYAVTIQKGAYQEYAKLCPFIASNSFSIGFNGEHEDEDFESKKAYDSKVRDTICKIIFDHFDHADENSVLLYQCSNSGGKGRNRFIAFNQWYNDLMVHNGVIQESESFKYALETIYLGYLVSNKNKFLHNINEEFRLFSKLMSEANK